MLSPFWLTLIGDSAMPTEPEIEAWRRRSFDGPAPQWAYSSLAAEMCEAELRAKDATPGRAIERLAERVARIETWFHPDTQGTALIIRAIGDALGHTRRELIDHINDVRLKMGVPPVVKHINKPRHRVPAGTGRSW
jgi:hypothetical protein